jgi:hypothetical protein
MRKSRNINLKPEAYRWLRQQADMRLRYYGGQCGLGRIIEDLVAAQQQRTGDHMWNPAPEGRNT